MYKSIIQGGIVICLMIIVSIIAIPILNKIQTNDTIVVAECSAGHVTLIFPNNTYRVMTDNQNQKISCKGNTK